MTNTPSHRYARLVQVIKDVTEPRCATCRLASTEGNMLSDAERTCRRAEPEVIVLDSGWCSEYEAIPELKQRADRLEAFAASGAHKPLRTFLQVDGWRECPAGLSDWERAVYVMHPGADGLVTTASVVQEARNTDFPCRIQIHEGSDKADVLLLLRRTIAWLERDYDGLWEPRRA